MLYIFEIDSYIIPVEFSVFARAYLGHGGFWDLRRTRSERRSNFVLIGYSMISYEIVGGHLKLVTHSAKKTSA